MKKPFALFPHITRLFSAVFLAMAVLICIANYTTGLQQLIHPNMISGLVLTSPFSPSVHLTLAEQFTAQKHSEESQQEVRILKDLLANEPQHVLGASVDIRQEILQWESRPEKMRANLAFWEQIIREKPDYRDAYIQSALAAMQLGQNSKALKLLNLARQLDPTISVDAFFQTEK